MEKIIQVTLDVVVDVTDLTDVNDIVDNLDIDIKGSDVVDVTSHEIIDFYDVSNY